MGQELFGVDIAGIIDGALSDGLLDVVLTRQVAGERAPGNLTGGRATTETVFTGIKGFWEDFTTENSKPPGITLELNDRKAVLIGDTIPSGAVPVRNDAVTIDEVTLYVVQPISVDAARAVYTFLCRDRKGPDGA